MDNNYVMEELKEHEVMEVNGGGLATAIVGGILGAGIGAYGGAVAAAVGIGSGKMSGSQARDVIKQSTMGGSGFGMTFGAALPFL